MLYVQKDLNDPSILKLENRTAPDVNTVCVAPEGEDVAWLDIVDNIDEITSEVVGKKAVVNEVTKAQVLADRQVAADAQALLDVENAAIAKKKARLEFGMEIKARVAILNDSKSWNASAWSTYQADVGIQQLSALLTDGYIETSKDLLAATDLSAYYTAEEKQGIIDRLVAYLASEA